MCFQGSYFLYVFTKHKPLIFFLWNEHMYLFLFFFIFQEENFFPQGKAYLDLETQYINVQNKIEDSFALNNFKIYIYLNISTINIHQVSIIHSWQKNLFVIDEKYACQSSNYIKAISFTFNGISCTQLKTPFILVNFSLVTGWHKRKHPLISRILSIYSTY